MPNGAGRIFRCRHGIKRSRGRYLSDGLAGGGSWAIRLSTALHHQESTRDARNRQIRPNSRQYRPKQARRTGRLAIAKTAPTVHCRPQDSSSPHNAGSIILKHCDLLGEATQRVAWSLAWEGGRSRMRGPIGGYMTGLQKQAGPEVFRPVIRKLRILSGAESDAELEAVLKHIKVRAPASRGEDIVGPGNAAKNFTVLLDGVACSYERLADGNRQIYAFHYPGDFCDLHQRVLPATGNEVVV